MPSEQTLLLIAFLIIVLAAIQVVILLQLRKSKGASNSIDKDTYASISAQALSQNNSQFLDLAEQRLNAQKADADNQLLLRKTEIENLLIPLNAQIVRLEEENRAMEAARNVAYGELTSRTDQMIAGATLLEREANSLTTALTKSSQQRGNWGEISLSNILELSGLRKGIDYHEQDTQSDGKRPDFVVDLPGGGKIPIDAKASGKKFLESIDETDDETRKTLLEGHAGAIKTRIKDLKKKAYRESVDGDVEAVVMFVPSEALLAITFDFDNDLHENAMKDDILIASPVSILALLKTIAFQWRQYTQAQNTREAIDICRELYLRFATWSEHYEKVGENMRKAANSYNKSVNSYQTRINPTVRRLNDIRLGEDLGKEVKELSTVEFEPNALPAPELTDSFDEGEEE